jgi:hypothetical protein
MRILRYGVALVVVVDFLVAVVQMQQAVIERASFHTPSVTTFGQYAVTLTSKTRDDLDLWVRDPLGHMAWFDNLQSGPLSLEHDMIPGKTDPIRDGVHELTMIRESAPGQYVANVDVYSGGEPAPVTVQLWDLRGFTKRVVLSRQLRLDRTGTQVTAFRWRLGAAGAVVSHDDLPANLVSLVGMTP